ncbi:hypothetical protein T11_16797, partial [Trichinella zimbabwensis]
MKAYLSRYCRKSFNPDVISVGTTESEIEPTLLIIW